MNRGNSSLYQKDECNRRIYIDCNSTRRNAIFNSDKSSKGNVNCYQTLISTAKNGKTNVSHECAIVDFEPRIKSQCNNLGDEQLSPTIPISNKSDCNLLSEFCVRKQTFIHSSDNYRNNEEEASSCLYSNQNSKQKLNIEKLEISDFKISDTTSSEISREEIRTRRRLKVIDIRKKKKLEKLQKTQNSSPTTDKQKLIPDFELSNASEEFPDLSVTRNNKKKLRNNLYDIASEPKINIESKRNKGIEKSWKPKVKDPILIDIGQALQNKPEKVKVVSRKVDPTAQRNVLKGNILDSDNPQQKKGKVRPNKQRKATKLKKQILLERNEKQKHCELNESSDNNSNVNIPMIPETTGCKGLKEDKAKEKQFKGCTRPSTSGFSDEINSLLATCTILDSDKISSSNNNNCNNAINQHHSTFESPIKTIYSKRFREYCTNCITEEVISSVCTLLEKLAYFQDRTFDRDPIRAQAKRRYVAGINQTKKYLIVKKVKLLVIAPDLEKNSGEGGLDNIIEYFKNEADNQGVPYIFGPKRKRLAKAVFKNALVSCVAVLSFEGAEELFSRVLEVLNDSKLKYQALINGTSNIIDNSTKDQNDIQESSKPETFANDYISADDVTSSLLAVLKGDLSPADRLLNAIHNTDWFNTKS